MASKRSKPVKKSDPFKCKDGYDLMGGAKITGHAAIIKPPMVPGTGMNMGMSRPL